MDSAFELRRTVRGLWLSATALGALAFVLRLVVIFWVQPVVWRMPSWLGLSTMLVVTFLAAAVPLGAYAARVRRHREPPRTFLVRESRAAFAVPVSPWFGCYVVMGMAIAAGTVTTIRGTDGGVDLADAGWLPAALVVEAIVTAATWWLLRGPSTELTPDGVVRRGLRGGLGGRTIPWDDVAANPASAWSGVSWLWIDPAYLRDAVLHYDAHPEHRAAIGTLAEMRRLRRALADDQPAEVTAAG